MKDKFIRAYMKVAETFAELSSARRLHVGAIVVRDDRIISIGYNGTPAGWDNNCEDRHYMDSTAGSWLSPEEIQKRWPLEDQQGRYCLTTRPEVLHAEMNALMKLARSTESGHQATMFVTHAPCLECAKGIFQAGIKSVFYKNSYRNTDGIDFLNRCGIDVIDINHKICS